MGENSYLTNSVLTYISPEYQVKGALMIEGDWGIGKSYFIHNELKKQIEQTNKKCIIVSLYGINSLDELCKRIYIALRTSRLKKPSKVKNTLISNASNIFKIGGQALLSTLKVTAGFDLNLNISDNALKKLYKNFDLSGRILIIEDFERSGIDVLRVLGFINSLTEEDGNKVIVVANENAILSYDVKKKTIKNNKGEEEEKEYYVLDAKSEEYKKIKEKTIIDTLVFKSDYVNSLKEIIEKYFKKTDLKKCINEDLLQWLYFKALIDRHYNLRTAIYAFQKCTELIKTEAFEILDKIEIKKIITSIFYLSIKVKMGSPIINKRVDFADKTFLEIEWESNNKITLYRYIYEYFFENKICEDLTKEYRQIIEQKNEKIELEQANKVVYKFMKVESFDRDEQYTKCYKDNIKLLKENKIPFNVYKPFLSYCVYYSKFFSETNLEDVISLMVENIRNSPKEVSLSSYNGGIYLNGEDYDKYKNLYDRLKFEANEKKTGKDKEFNDVNKALEELSAKEFYEYCYNRNFSKGQKGFSQNINVEIFKKIIENATLDELSYYSSSFKTIYNIVNVKDFYQDDVESLLKIKESLNEISCVGQKMKAERLRYFIKYIEEAVESLQQPI